MLQITEKQKNGQLHSKKFKPLETERLEHHYVIPKSIGLKLFLRNNMPPQDTVL